MKKSLEDVSVKFLDFLIKIFHALLEIGLKALAVYFFTRSS
jgi:hypothetical protein